MGKMIVYHNGQPIVVETDIPPPQPRYPICYPQEQYPEPIIDAEYSIQKHRKERRKKNPNEWGLASKSMLFFAFSWIPAAMGLPFITIFSWFAIIVWLVRRNER